MERHVSSLCAWRVIADLDDELNTCHPPPPPSPVTFKPQPQIFDWRPPLTDQKRAERYYAEAQLPDKLPIFTRHITTPSQVVSVAASRAASPQTRPLTPYPVQPPTPADFELAREKLEHRLLYKTTPCRSYDPVRKSCVHGSKCRFVHPEDQVRERPDRDIVEQTIREEAWRIAEMRQVSATARCLKA